MNNWTYPSPIAVKITLYQLNQTYNKYDNHATNKNSRNF